MTIRRHTGKPETRLKRRRRPTDLKTGGTKNKRNTKNAATRNPKNGDLFKGLRGVRLKNSFEGGAISAAAIIAKISIDTET